MVGAGTSTPSDERSGEGARGKGRQRPPPASPPAGERKGAGGKVRQRPPPASPPAGERQGARGEGEGATPTPLICPRVQPPSGQVGNLPLPVRERARQATSEAVKGPGGRGGSALPLPRPSGGAEGGWGEGEGATPTPLICPRVQPPSGQVGNLPLPVRERARQATSEAVKGLGGRRGSALALPRPQRGRGRGLGGKGRERRRHPSYALASSRPAGRLETCPYRCGNEHARRRVKR